MVDDCEREQMFPVNLCLGHSLLEHLSGIFLSIHHFDKKTGLPAVSVIPIFYRQPIFLPKKGVNPIFFGIFLGVLTVFFQNYIIQLKNSDCEP